MLPDAWMCLMYEMNSTHAINLRDFLGDDISIALVLFYCNKNMFHPNYMYVLVFMLDLDFFHFHQAQGTRRRNSSLAYMS